MTELPWLNELASQPRLSLFSFNLNGGNRGQGAWERVRAKAEQQGKRLKERK